MSAAKRTATKSSSTAIGPPQKKKRGAAVHIEIPTAPKKRGRVFACGQGDVGQLGLRDIEETNKFKHVTALGGNIVAVCAGGMHTVALDSSGKVWTYGCNDEGALGRNTTGDKDEGTPKKVTLPAKAVAISAGDSHSAALLETGDVYAWGSFRDSHGSMGLVVRGREGVACREPVPVPIGETGVGIASGSDHLVVLSSSGGVYTMGCGEQGQLGRLSQRSASRDARQGLSALLEPGKVTLKLGASAVWAGYHATFVLDGNREKMFAFGLNNYGQLGITGEKRKTALYAPVECDAFARRETTWRSVAPGQHHSLALNDAGQVHVVGRCEYGRLGLGAGAGDAAGLEPVPALQGKRCVAVAAGTCSSFAVTDNGEVWAWGMGSEGQLGTGSSADAAEPAPCVLEALEHCPRAVAAGGQHTVILTEDPNPGEEETAEEKTEASEEKVEEEETEPRAKRHKTPQQAKVSSTSKDAKPQIVNGDDNKDIAMEVDETDNKQQTQETKEDQPASVETSRESVPETKADDSSQGTSDSETKSQDSQDSNKTQDSTKTQDSQESNKTQDSIKSQDLTKNQASDSQDSKDVEMTEKAEVNGTDDSEKIEAKTVEGCQTPLTTSA